MSLTRPPNHLLEYLPDRECNRILESCKTVELHYGDILCDFGQAYKHVFFPLSTFISLQGKPDAHPPLDVRLVGNEGMLGVTVVLGIRDAPLRGMVEGTGRALRLSVPQFRHLLRNNPALVRMLKRYLYVTLEQLALATSCTHFHPVEKRLARWLLMIHDRALADHFHLTHQHLAHMLGVLRSAVTIAAGTLQQQGLISYNRGEISILNRSGLEEVSCECYETMNADYKKFFSQKK